MTTPLPDPGLEALLGAYVLDALDPDERDRVDAYLSEHAGARAEVDALRETAASLATAPLDATPAPRELWERIAADIGSEPSNDELEARRARRRGPGTLWVTSSLATAAAIVAVVLAVQVVSLRGDLDDAQRTGRDAIAKAYGRAAGAPGAVEVELTRASGDAGAEVARVALLPDGTGYLLADGLEPLTDEQTYQLWAVVGHGDTATVVSAGVLGPAPEAAAFTVDGPVRQFALTVEREGGVVSSEQDPYAAGTVA